jgi:hypothetical protein
VRVEWTLAVDRDALHFLLSANRRDRTKLLDAMDGLVSQPHQPCDFVLRSPNQRDYSVKMIGRFVVTYWLEPEKIVRVVRIERIKGG